MTKTTEPVIYDQTEARARTFVVQLAWLLPCLLVFVLFFTTSFRGLHMPEAMEAAQLGRHISEGEGYTTSLLRPFALMPKYPVTGQPETLHAPLYPVVLAVAFNLLAPEDRTVALVAMLCAVLTALLAYALARRLLDRTAAGLAAVFVSVNLGFLSAGTEGSNLPLLALLTTVLGYLLLRHGGRLRHSAWCGATCGLLYLAEYAMLPMLAAAMLAAVLKQPARRLTHALVFFIGFAVLAGPWLARDWRLSGGPFSTPRARTIASFTDYFPQTSLYRSSPKDVPSSLAYLTAHPTWIARKALRNLGALQGKVPEVLEGALILLLGVALLTGMQGEARRLRWVTFGGAGLVALNLAVGEPSFDILYGFLGLVAALSAAALLPLLRARKLSHRGAWALLACIVVLASSQLVLTVLLRPRPTAADRQSVKFLTQLPAGALVMTDEPWAVAWYANRPALWLAQESAPTALRVGTKPASEWANTTRQPEFIELERLGFRPSAILLTSRLPAYAEREEMTRWNTLRQLLEQQVLAMQRGLLEGREPWAPPGWVVAATFPPGEFVLQRADTLKEE